jgi:hypothetical protein
LRGVLCVWYGAAVLTLEELAVMVLAVGFAALVAGRLVGFIRRSETGLLVMLLLGTSAAAGWAAVLLFSTVLS